MHPPRCFAPGAFFAELLDQYLLAVLYGLLYESLAAENRQRLEHMEHASKAIDHVIAAAVAGSPPALRMRVFRGLLQT